MNPEVLQLLALFLIVALVIFYRTLRQLLDHQQKMAVIVRQSQTNPQMEERVMRELSELRQLVVQQSLAIENIRTEKALPATIDSVQNRLNV